MLRRNAPPFVSFLWASFSRCDRQQKHAAQQGSKLYIRKFCTVYKHVQSTKKNQPRHFITDIQPWLHYVTASVVSSAASTSCMTPESRKPPGVNFNPLQQLAPPPPGTCYDQPYALFIPPKISHPLAKFDDYNATQSRTCTQHRMSVHWGFQPAKSNCLNSMSLFGIFQPNEIINKHSTAEMSVL